MTPPTTLRPTPPPRAAFPHGTLREERSQFVRWALAQLQIAVEESGDDLILQLSDADRTAFAGQQRLRLPRTGSSKPGQESLAFNGRFGRWLLDRLERLGPAVHARPKRQPMGVTDISATLFGAYQVEKGQVHLAGCQLTDHPFLRLSFADEDDESQVRHVFVAPDGSSITESLIPQLGLDALEPIAKLPPRLEPAALRSLEAAARRVAAAQAGGRQPSPTLPEPIATAVLWVRHAEGRLQFTIGNSTASVSFSSWAALLTPPPFVAKHSGTSTFRLAATDDGRIDAADQIAVCGQSGRRVLRQDLVECSVTGKRVLADFTEICPVSGKRALRHEFAGCTVCRQRVSKAVLEEGVCAACRSLAKASKDDPRLVWIFGEYPGLARWKSWQLAETQTAYIAQAAGLLKRLLVVVDKESLAVRRLATAGRMGASWIDLLDAARDEVLK